jgi:hypothetical protein
MGPESKDSPRPSPSGGRGQRAKRAGEGPASARVTRLTEITAALTHGR